MVKNPPANAGDTGSVLGSGRSPGEGSGNPLQISCLGNRMDRGAWPGCSPLSHKRSPINDIIVNVKNQFNATVENHSEFVIARFPVFLKMLLCTNF